MRQEATHSREAYRNRLRQNFRASLNADEMLNCESCTTVFVNQGSHALKLSVILVIQESGSTPAGDIEDEDDYGDSNGLDKPPSFELLVWRFVNGTPLMSFTNANDVSCVLHEAVTEIDWTPFGHKLMVECFYLLQGRHPLLCP